MSVGVPQIAKVQLLDETMTAGRSDYYSYSVNRKLTEQAEYAFTTIYNEVTNAAKAQYMDSHLFAELNEKVSKLLNWPTGCTYVCMYVHLQLMIITRFYLISSLCLIDGINI